MNSELVLLPSQSFGRSCESPRAFTNYWSAVCHPPDCWRVAALHGPPRCSRRPLRRAFRGPAAAHSLLRIGIFAVDKFGLQRFLKVPLEVRRSARSRVPTPPLGSIAAFAGAGTQQPTDRGRFPRGTFRFSCSARAPFLRSWPDCLRLIASP